MISSNASGFSTEGPSAALAQALNGASGAGDGMASVQVIVQGIVKVGKGWRASVLILMEPKPANDLKHKKGPQLDKNKEEDEKKKQKEALKLKLEHDFQAFKHREEILKMHQLEQKEAINSLYIDVVFELVFHPIEPQFDFDYVHYIASGSLWDEVLRHYPHLEMHEAAHDAKPKPKPSYRKEVKPRDELTEELLDELT